MTLPDLTAPTCRDCGLPIRPATEDERSPSSAWAAVDCGDEGQPLPCTTVLGHAPTGPEPMHLWGRFTHPDGREQDIQLDTIPGSDTATHQRRIDALGPVSGVGSWDGWTVTYTLRPTK